MIVKELDQFYGISPQERAGRKAEEQLAFYLKRRFHANPDIFVINGLRFLALDGTYAQIDHLILSRYCAVIVESKSVTSVVKYDNDGQWLRLWDNHWIGMPNPVQQIKNQEVALRELLQDHRETLRKKYLGFNQGGFLYLPICHIAAISDAGRVMTPPGKEDIYAGVVLKADLVTDKIIELFEEYKRNNSLLSVKMTWDMPPEDLAKTVKFLLECHEPGVKAAEPPVAEKVAPPPKVAAAPKATQPEKISSLSHCPVCRGKVAILWGEKYKNYYWHCDACGKNIAISFKCPGCGEKLRIRKQGSEYHIYCEPCDLSALYFIQK